MLKQTVKKGARLSNYLRRTVYLLWGLAIILLGNASNLMAQNGTEKSYIDTTHSYSKKYFLGTSVLSSLSLAFPSENTLYFQLDFGLIQKNGDNIILGILAYQYRRPHSQPYNDNSTYDGYVLSYGPVMAYQIFFWREFFIMPIVNPLVMDYKRDNGAKIHKGFMLLCAARIGYSFDFKIKNVPFFIEPSVEINYWPINTNTPIDFKLLDEKFNNYVFAPGLNIGIKF